MSDKQRALQLQQSGLSYMEIAKTLGIGKTTAYQYVREARQEKDRQASRQGLPVADTHVTLEIGTITQAINNTGADEDIRITAAATALKQEHPPLAGLQKDSVKHKSIFGRGLADEQMRKLKEQLLLNQGTARRLPINDATNLQLAAEKEKEKKTGGAKTLDTPTHVKNQASAAQTSAYHDKPTQSRQISDAVVTPQKQKPVPHEQSPAPLPKPPKLKEFTGDELMEKTFECLPFTGKFLELIGAPSKLFAGMIWGMPKGGKSNFCIRFADYLQEYFGKVIYIAAEEGESVTLQEKFKEIGGSKVTVVETRDRDAIRAYLPHKPCDFVFIDSINNAGIDNDFLEELKAENPRKSFIAIVQATKGGKFKGDQALTHNCDFIIEIIDGIAYQNGRFSAQSEVSIFEEPLYEKNLAYIANAASKARGNKGNSGDFETAAEHKDPKARWQEVERTNGKDDGALGVVSDANAFEKNLELTASETESGVAFMQPGNQAILLDTSAAPVQLGGIQNSSSALAGTNRATSSRSVRSGSEISFKRALWISGGLAVLLIYAHNKKERLEEQEKKKKAEQERRNTIALAQRKATSVHAQRSPQPSQQSNRQPTGQLNFPQRQTGVAMNQHQQLGIKQRQQILPSAANQMGIPAQVHAKAMVVYKRPIEDWEDEQNLDYGQNYEWLL